MVSETNRPTRTVWISLYFLTISAYSLTTGTFSQQILFAAVSTSVNLKSFRYCLNFSAAPFVPT